MSNFETASLIKMWWIQWIFSFNWKSMAKRNLYKCWRYFTIRCFRCPKF